jgi:hypothetical protein
MTTKNVKKKNVHISVPPLNFCVGDAEPIAGEHQELPLALELADLALRRPLALENVRLVPELLLKQQNSLVRLFLHVLAPRNLAQPREVLRGPSDRCCQVQHSTGVKGALIGGGGGGGRRIGRSSGGRSSGSGIRSSGVGTCGSLGTLWWTASVGCPANITVASGFLHCGLLQFRANCLATARVAPGVHGHGLDGRGSV